MKKSDNVDAIIETLFADEKNGAIWLSKRELYLLQEIGILSKTDMLYINIFCKTRDYDGKTLVMCPEYSTLKNKALTKLVMK